MLLRACLFLLALASVATVARADVIVLAADPRCPYNCEPDADRPGYMVEMAREILGAAGHRVVYERQSWTSALRMVRSGRIAGVIGAGRGDDVTLVFPDRPQGRSFNGLATRKGYAFAWNGPQSLEGHRLGVIRDYSYGAALDPYILQHGSNPERITVASGFGYETLRGLLRSLEAGGVDVVADDHNVLFHTVSELALHERVTITYLDDPDDVFVAFSPENPHAKAYAALMSEGTERLRATGRLKEILARYGLPDWER